MNGGVILEIKTFKKRRTTRTLNSTAVNILANFHSHLYFNFVFILLIIIVSGRDLH